MNFVEIWKRSHPISKVLFVLILLYIVFSVYILLWRFNVVDNVLMVEDNAMLIIYSLASFSFVVIIAVFHLITLILRRKRVTDYTRPPS